MSKISSLYFASNVQWMQYIYIYIYIYIYKDIKKHNSNWVAFFFFIFCLKKKTLIYDSSDRKERFTIWQVTKHLIVTRLRCVNYYTNYLLLNIKLRDIRKIHYLWRKDEKDVGYLQQYSSSLLEYYTWCHSCCIWWRSPRLNSIDALSSMQIFSSSITFSSLNRRSVTYGIETVDMNLMIIMKWSYL